jgi:hypothetical protein
MVRSDTWLAGALIAACAAGPACGESVKTGGVADGNGGSSSAGDGPVGDGGDGLVAGAGAGNGGTAAGVGAGGAGNSGAGGSAGIAQAGSGGSVAGGGTGGAGSGGTDVPAAGDGGSMAGAGGGMGGAASGGSDGGAGAGGGGQPVPDTLPTCITDLYAACWPEGACTLDEASGTRCYESGVRVVVEHAVDGCFEQDARTKYYKADGSLCFEHFDVWLSGHACETHSVTWRDASGAIVADQSSSYTNPPRPPKAYPTCGDMTATPCSGDRCSYPSAQACTPGTCGPPN